MSGNKRKPDPKTWHMSRLGFFNFWYYDDEIFELTDGRLIFFGDNGSGKSVSMQSVLPVLLDGRFYPTRLDPFGSRSRRMEDYLMGEKELASFDERTGYVFLEFKGPNESHLTIGVGLHYRWEGQLSAWFFVLENNLRIGHNFALFEKSSSGEKIPLSFKKMKEMIPSPAAGLVTRERKEYQERVNKSLFGFAHVKAYDDLIKLLIELRSPKLSKDYKPSILYEILNTALPDLPEENLRPLSESIEALANIGERLEKKKAEIKSVRQLGLVFRHYHARSLLEKCERLVRIDNRLTGSHGAQVEHAAAVEKIDQSLELAELEKNRLMARKNILEAEQSSLRDHNAFRLAEQLIQVRKQEVESQSRYNASAESQAQRQKKLQSTQRAIAENLKQQGALQVRLENVLDELDSLATSVGFRAHSFERLALLAGRWHEYDFAPWRNQSRSHEKLIQQALQQIELVERRLEQANLAAQKVDAERFKYDGLLADLQRFKDQVQQESEALTASLGLWFDTHADLLPFTEEQKTRIMNVAWELFREYEEPAFIEPVTACYLQSHRQLEQSLAQAGSDLRLMKQNESEKRKQLNSIKQASDPVPTRSQATLDNRASLRSNAVPHAAFYELIDFKDGLSDAAKARVEAALIDSQMLDALVFPADQGRETELWKSDRALGLPQESGGSAIRLDHYLKVDCSPDCGIDSNTVQSLLHSLCLDSGFELGTDGSYRIGPLTGHAHDYGQARFIGKEARQRYRKQQIEDLEAELSQLQESLAKLSERIEETRKHMQQLESAYKSLPSTRNLQRCVEASRSKQTEVGFVRKAWEQSTEDHQKSVEALNAVRRQLDELRPRLHLDLKRDTLDQAAVDMRHYISQIQSLEHDSRTFGDRLESGTQLKLDLDAELQEIARQREIVQSLLQDLEEKKASIVSLESQLAIHGIDAIRERMRLVLDELNSIPQRQLEGVRQEEKLRHQRDEHGRALAENAACISELEQLRSVCQQMIDSELKLGVLEIPGNPNSVQELAADIRRLHPQEQQRALERLKLSAIEAHHKQANELLEYGPRVREGELLPQLPAPEEPRYAEDWTSLTAANDYIIAEFRLVGKTVNIVELQRQLEEDLVTDQAYYSETDRELYEEVLLNNVGQALCEQIARCHRWVEGMDRVMSSLRLTSGLSFSIKWIETNLETDESLRTRDLVRLLADPKTLVKDDQTRLVGHFRSRIEGSLAQQRDAGDPVSYHDAIRRALDYRNWYRFQIFVKKSSEGAFVKLSDRLFNTFSGGEKATAMYLPLWTAVSSHYDGASPSAPRIISLDEAFAGVDSTNIRSMFALIEEMGFGFLMNSQVIRGDYDTISGLTIAELYRPQGVNLVTSTQYRWNGSIRSLMMVATQDETKLGFAPMDALFNDAEVFEV